MRAPRLDAAELRTVRRPGAAPVRPGFFSALALTALGASAFAVAFRGLLTLVYRALTGADNAVSAMRALPLPARLLLPAIGGLLAGLTGLAAARLPSSHGVGDVMEAAVLGRVRLSLRVTLLKCLGSFSAIVGGGSLGREGPLIQFGAALGQTLGRGVQATGVEARALVAAGAAAGFAAAYNTPFAAVLFVVEVVVGVVALETLAPVLVAVVLASSVSRALGDSGPLFGQHNFETQSTLELAAFALVGALAAVAGHGFLHLLSTVEGRYRHLVPTLPWRPALGALGTGLVLVVLPDVAGNGAEPLRLVLDARLGAGALALLLGAKVLATASSVGSGSPGGVFTPTMLLGGGVGALTAMGLHALGIPAGASGGYALVGMAAAVAGTTHAPIMAAVLAFEMTGDYAIVVPLMLATTVAVVVAQRLSPESLYTRELLARGVRWRLSVEGGRVVEREELVSNGEGI